MLTFVEGQKLPFTKGIHHFTFKMTNFATLLFSFVLFKFQYTIKPFYEAHVLLTVFFGILCLFFCVFSAQYVDYRSVSGCSRVWNVRFFIMYFRILLCTAKIIFKQNLIFLAIKINITVTGLIDAVIPKRFIKSHKKMSVVNAKFEI